MMRHLAYIAAFLLAFPMFLHAQGADEKYIYIYTMIQEADGLLSRGQKADALAKYREAHAALKQLQEVHPTWNPKVVNYRLNYIIAQAGSPEPKFAPAVPGADTTNAILARGESPQVPPTQTVATNDLAQLRAMQEQIAFLTQQNAKLEAKLKEAWRVQPAAADPQEMAKTQHAMVELQKERDALKASLEDARTKPDMTSAIEQERKILADVRQQLAQKVELAGTLQKENEALKGQVLALNGSSPNADRAIELQVAKMAIAAMQATNIALLTENILLQNQMAEIARDVTPRSNSRDIERERDELRRRLEAANRGMAKRKKTGRGAEREPQFQTALARLEAYEAKPVPYTPEELALFKQPDMKVVISDPIAVKKKPRELPAGAGPLMADAQRAMEAGRFDQAEARLAEILRQDENNIVVLGHVASVQMDQNKLADAEQTLTKALTVDSQDPASLYLMGRLRLLQEKYDQALDALSLSAKVMPEDPRTQYWLGKVLIQKGQRAAAETALRKAVQLRPGWGEAHYSLAMVYATQQPPFKELAQWHYQKALTGGYPRNVEFEKLIEEKRASSQRASQ